jgi:hypothetical protein
MASVIQPTHFCKKCGAFWILHPGDGGWSLFSRRCGTCCDNVAMGEQIETLPTLTMHPAAEQLMKFFAFNHLPPLLASVSAPFGELAWRIAFGPQNAEATVALRKLLEAKDCAVRAALA